jgi:hypothetical protein
LNDGFVVFGAAFVVSDEAAVPADPPECSLDHPTSGQGFEAGEIIGALDYLDGQ